MCNILLLVLTRMDSFLFCCTMYVLLDLYMYDFFFQFGGTIHKARASHSCFRRK